tara:strand:+ start:979 stop:1344 length:366 start_codon:yes stop_codon:yes gene_type:complete
MQKAESIYDSCLAELKNAHANIDPYLLMKIMYLERTASTTLALDQKGELPDAPPMLEIEIEFKKGTDTSKIIHDMQARGIQAMHHRDEVYVKSTMTASDLCEIASNQDIEMIHGHAYPASF